MATEHRVMADADAGKPSVQSLIDKFEQLAARASGRPGPVACGPRHRRVRCLSDCAPLLSGCDDLALRRHVLTKRSVDMTSTTSTTSISSDDEEDEEDVDVDVDEGDDHAVDEPQAEADSDDSAADREDAKDKADGVPDAQEDDQQLEPPIVPVALPPIDETAAERPSDAETDAQELASDDREESHNAGCACSRCWLQQSAAHVVDNQVEHEPAPSVSEDAATHSSHHDAPLTLEDLCTLHVALIRPDAAATKLLQPSKIPQPRFSYAARRASLGHNALASPTPTTDNAASRRNSLAAGARSRIPALNASTPSRRNSLAAAPSAAACRSSSTAGVQPTPSRSQTRRNSLAPITAPASSSGSSSRRQSAPSISSNSVASGSSAATGKPRPRYLDYAQSPRFAALKAQNLERRRLAEEKSRALAAATPAAKASPRRFTPDAAASSASLALSSGSSLASSAASASSVSLASSLPPRSTRRPELPRARGLEHDAGRRPRRQLRSQSS